MSKRSVLIIPIMFLIITAIACGLRVFGELHVYSGGDHSLDEAYDEVEDEILMNDVWVFRPDGTFDAKLEIEDEIVEFAGNYAGDDAGDGFYFVLDLDLDGEFDDEILVDVENDSFSFIEWTKDGVIYRYTLVE